MTSNTPPAPQSELATAAPLTFPMPPMPSVGSNVTNTLSSSSAVKPKRTAAVRATEMAEAEATAESEQAPTESADSTESEADAGVVAPPPSVPVHLQRCGLVAIIGKPNVGKSTLLNSLVGQKISIVSRKAQTTRHRITGMHTQGAAQFVFVDTPGFQTRHSNALNRNMNKTVQNAVSGVDLVVFVVEAGSFTPSDAQVLALVPQGTPCLLVANKLDNVHRRGDIAPWLADMGQRHKFSEYVPMSAKNPKDVARLLTVCEQFLPLQAWWYGEDELTDRSEKFLTSEIIREKIFRLTGDELPYTSTVVIDQFTEEPGKSKARFLRVAATIIVERDTHKAMVIGEQGEKLKRIGTEARMEMEKLMDARVFLQIWVKVKSGWADNAARLKTFGYD